MQKDLRIVPFQWDSQKNQTNFTKHGVTFEEATKIFDGPTFTVIDKRYDYVEMREISIGMLGSNVVAVVVHTDRNGITRLTSARTANRQERQVFYGYL
jgi:uncharacterized DUF497 family protein